MVQYVIAMENGAASTDIAKTGDVDRAVAARMVARRSAKGPKTVTTKDQVLACLAKIPGPATGTLSDIVVSDGKVFFSISVNADAVSSWETVRKRVDEAVRALPGVTSVMVALTAERKGGTARPAQGAPAGRAAWRLPP